MHRSPGVCMLREAARLRRACVLVRVTTCEYVCQRGPHKCGPRCAWQCGSDDHMYVSAGARNTCRRMCISFNSATRIRQVAGCCRVLQGVAVCWQCVGVAQQRGNDVLQCCSELQWVAVSCVLVFRRSAATTSTYVFVRGNFSRAI